MSPNSAGGAFYGVSPAGIFKILSIIVEARNANSLYRAILEHRAGLGASRLALLLTAGYLRHALLLGEYGDLAIFAHALGLHRAMALEERAFLNHKYGGRQVSAHLGVGANLDPLRCDDIAADLARDRHGRGANLRSDDGALADHEAVLGVDLAVNFAVDTRGTLE